MVPNACREVGMKLQSRFGLLISSLIFGIIAHGKP